jgi:hypothetical protein
LGGNPEGLTDMQLLERYLISKQISPERQEQLMHEAESIFEGAAGLESST